MDKLPIDISKGWLPDLRGEDLAKAGGLSVAKNLYPITGDYFPVSSAVDYNTTALSGSPLRGIYIQDTDGSYYNFIGTETKLYRVNSAALTDITKLTATYAAAHWDYEVFGDWMIATDFEYAPQVLKGLTAANFIDLGGTPPKAKYCLMKNGHLILGHLFDSTTLPKKIQWSARENVESWPTPGTTTAILAGAGAQDFPEMDGIITGLANMGEQFGVFAENSITLGSYVGGTYTFAFDWNAVTNIGCFFPGTLVSIGDRAFWWSQKSIWMWNGFGDPIEIGMNLRRTVVDSVNLAYDNRISSGHDPLNGIVYWAYPDQTSTGGPNKILAYSYVDNKFTEIDIGEFNALFSGVAGDKPVDSLVGIKVDDLGAYRVDSNYWIGKSIELMVVGSDSKVKTFSGAPVEAEIQTGEVHGDEGVFQALSVLTAIERLAGSGSVTVYHRYSPADLYSASSANLIKSNGFADLRTTDRRFEFNLKATNFERIGKGLVVYGEADGDR